MSLYHKYRPKNLSELVGNSIVIEQIRRKFSTDRKPKPHAILLSGPTGCGKTTIARIISRMLLCKGSDFSEFDSADFRGIDTIRDIRRNSHFQPIRSASKVYLLDECHKLTPDAQAALLKALEDPPPFVYYILATTDPQKLIAPIRGRCQQFKVKPLMRADMRKLLLHITKAEGKTISKSIIRQIIKLAEGLPRNAIQLLDLIIGLPKDQQLKTLEDNEAQSEVIDLCRALTSKAPWSKISRILKSLKDKEEDPEKIRLAILGYCSSYLLNRDFPYIAGIMEQMIEPFYNSNFNGLIYACYASIK